MANSRYLGKWYVQFANEVRVKYDDQTERQLADTIDRYREAKGGSSHTFNKIIGMVRKYECNCIWHMNEVTYQKFFELQNNRLAIHTKHRFQLNK